MDAYAVKCVRTLTEASKLLKEGWIFVDDTENGLMFRKKLLKEK